MKILILILMLLFPLLIISFEEILIELTIEEEQENGTIIVDLRRYISSLITKDLNGYKVKFVRPCLYFYFDEKRFYEIRGLKLDREKICPYENECKLICNLFIEKEEMKLIELKILLKDINDHKPTFLKEIYSYSIEETIPIGFNIQLEQAEDKDFSNENSTYFLNEIENWNSFPFQLNFDQKNHLLQLIVIKQILFQKYQFELIVKDQDQFQDQCQIIIEIIQQKNNSFSPQFQKDFYQFFILNQTETFIGQVHANILHSNNQIFYRFIPSIENHLFEINQISGQIFLKQNIHFFDLFYQLFIEASSFNSLSAITTVHIYFNFTQQIQEQNEHFIQIFIPKIFQQNHFQEKLNHQIFIQENSIVPLTILQLFISSSSSPSSSLQMIIPSNYQNDFFLKQLDEQSFEFILLKSLDFEQIQFIQIYFILNNQTSTKKIIDLFIQDQNDCQPYFNQTNFLFQIQENNQIPSHIYTFQALDQDQIQQFNYQIQNSDENVFSINSTSGELWTLKSFDREMKSNYSLSICVFDQVHRTCSTILINILDENDNICQFNSSFLTLTINENLPSNTFLTQFQAFDSDFGINSTLEYSLSSKTSYLNINATSGILQTTINSFDYELIQNYSTLIIACDNIHSFPSLCCNLQFNLIILDLDDNFPYLIYPSSQNEIFIINYTNQKMPRLKAFDNDISFIHRQISYSIIAGSLNSSITIDHRSGQLNLLPISKLPLYGTLIISLSSQTNIQLTILIHDNQTDPQLFLMSINPSSSQLFYFITFISIGILICLLPAIFLIYHFFQQQHKHDDDPLMNTPSTTTLSNRSISTNKKIYDTYYSFGDTVGPGIIHI